MPKRATLYIRVSSDEQARHGLSLGEQRADLLNYAKEHGYVVMGIYADEGVTARKAMSRRKELQRLLADVERGLVDIIVIKCLDRWFRNIADFYKVKEKLDAHGVDWECSREQYNTTTPNGLLMLNLKLSIAQNESDQTSERIKYVFEGKKQRGECLSGHLPLGLISVDHHAVRDEKTAPIVKYMFDHIQNGGAVHSLVQLVYEQFGRRFSGSGICRILRNRVYIGEMYGIPDYIPAIIPHDTFQRAQNILAKNTKFASTGRIYLFTGLLRCPQCGLRLSGNRGRRISSDGNWHFQYHCRARVNRDMPGCHFARGVYEEKVERYLLDNLQSLIREYFVQLDERRQQQGNERPEARIETLKAKLSRLEDVYLDGMMDKEKYVRTYKEISAEISELSSLIDHTLTAPHALQEVVDDKDFRNTYELLTQENKQQFWKSIIESITFDDTPETRGRGAYIPFRVSFL